jgi:cytochrome c biogenesis protein CcdA
MSRKQSFLQSILSLIISVLKSNIEMQIKEYKRRTIRILAILFVGFSLFFVGLGYLAYSLAIFLVSMYGLFALGLVGFVFALLGVIVMMLARMRS